MALAKQGEYFHSNDLKIPRHLRNRHTLRTLGGIIDDHNRFLASGGVKDNVKNFNNVLGSHFLDIDLDHVCTN
jgi:hypothetical protein